MRTCLKCGRDNVTTNAGPASCRDCQPRKNTIRKLPGQRRVGTPRGEAHGRARLNADAVRAIRERSAAGESNSILAREFGVTSSNVYLVVKRKIWASI